MVRKFLDSNFFLVLGLRLDNVLISLRRKPKKITDGRAKNMGQKHHATLAARIVRSVDYLTGETGSTTTHT